VRDDALEQCTRPDSGGKRGKPCTDPSGIGPLGRQERAICGEFGAAVGAVDLFLRTLVQMMALAAIFSCVPSGAPWTVTAVLLFRMGCNAHAIPSFGFLDPLTEQKTLRLSWVKTLSPLV
jgi:hypothetical protein